MISFDTETRREGDTLVIRITATPTGSGFVAAPSALVKDCGSTLAGFAPLFDAARKMLSAHGRSFEQPPARWRWALDCAMRAETELRKEIARLQRLDAQRAAVQTVMMPEITAAIDVPINSVRDNRGWVGAVERRIVDLLRSKNIEVFGEPSSR